MSGGAALDLVVTGGRYLTDGLADGDDIGFRDGAVAEIGPGLTARAARTIDARGGIVAPGLVDTHGHFFVKGHKSAADPLRLALRSGATTLVDGGTTGSVIFPAFAEYVARPNPVTLLGFVNISALGLAGGRHGVPDLFDPRLLNVDETTDAIRSNRDIAVGVKVRADVTAVPPDSLLATLDAAREIAAATGTRLMVHAGDSGHPLAAILERLAPGDILTHVFHGADSTILDEQGRIGAPVLEARERGILFDVGHGGSHHFDLALARTAIDQGFVPDLYSSDMLTVPPTFAVPPVPINDVLSIFLDLGVDLPALVASATSVAARAIGRDDELGALRVGARDLVVLRLAEEPFEYHDAHGERGTGTRHLVPETVIARGRVLEPATASAA